MSYAYNARNLLESWTDGEHSETYRYNASGLLSSVTTDASTTALTWDTLYGEGVVLSADTDGSGSASPATLAKQQVEEDTRTTGENGGKSWIKKVWENASNGMITDLENQTKNMELTSKELELVGAGIKFIGQWTKCTEQELIENQIKQTQLLYESASQVDMAKAAMIITSTGEIVGGLVIIAGSGGVATPAGSTLVGAGVSSLAGGFVSEALGESFTSGWVGDEIGGLITGGTSALGEYIGMNNIMAKAIALDGSFLGGLVGNRTSQRIEYGAVDVNAALEAGSLNVATVFIMMPYGSVSTEILSDVSTGVIGKIVGSGVVLVNEVITDGSSAVLGAEMGG